MIIPISKSLSIIAPEKPAYPYSNCLYIEDDCPTLIDLGAGGNALQAIANKEIALCLISHSHFDHLHSEPLFEQTRLMAGIEEAQVYTDETAYNDFHGYSLWKELMPADERQGLGEVVPLPDDVLVKPGFRPIPIADYFSDGQVIDLGSSKITAVHLPGHTIGHYGFWLEKEGVLFSADLDLSYQGPWYSCNTSDIGSLLSSIEKIKKLEPQIIVTSHRRQAQSSNLNEQLDRYGQVLIGRENRIYDLLLKPHTLDQLSEYGLVFPARRNIYEQFWEKISIQKHLTHLLSLNLIREIDPGCYQKT
ncbi:MAG: MBL fold metallo-hydrolase [Syntrophomonadaceae bacterium]